MKPLVLSLAIAGALTLTGCSSLVSVNPFVTQEQSVMDPALLGLWTEPDAKEVYWIRQDGNGYRIRYASETESVDFKAYLMVAGEVKVLDLSSANEDPFQVPAHTAIRVWTGDGTLRIAFLQTDWLKEQAGRQLAIARTRDRALITSPGEMVRAFLAKAAADPKATDEPGVLHRVQ